MGNSSSMIAAREPTNRDIELGRRASQRIDTLSLIGKIDHAGLTSPCIIRNLADTGAMLEVPVPLQIEDKIFLEFRGIAPKRAEVRWARNQSVGVKFDVPIPIAEMLQPVLRCRQQPRDPRFTFLAPARIRVGPRLLMVNTLDISHKGAKLSTNEVLPIGQIALFNIRGLAQPRLGKICWDQAGESGIVFKDRLSVDELSCLLLLNRSL